LIERMAFERPLDAEEAADLVVGIGQAAGDTLCAAFSLWIAANVHFILDHAAEALRLFEQAEALYRRQGDLLQIARLSVGKISALDKLGRYEEALACGQAVMPLLAASTDPADQRRLAGVYNGIGISSEHLGRYLEALDGYERKLAWWQARQGPAAEVETARSLVNIGVVKTRLGLYVEALTAFTEARRRLTQVGDSGQARADIARIDMNVAWLETQRQSPPEVITAAFDRARRSQIAADPTGASTDLALLDLFAAEWRTHTAQMQAPDEAALAALRDRFAAEGLAYKAARTELLLGDLALRANDTGCAFDIFAQVGEAARQRGDAEIALMAEVGQARVARRQGRRGAARQRYEAALAQIERIRLRLPVDEYRAGYLEDKLLTYQELAALLLEEGDPLAALQTVERAKARTLAEVLPIPSAGVSADAAAEPQMNALRSELRALRERLEQRAPALSSDEAHDLEARIVHLAREIQRLEADPIVLAPAQSLSVESIAGQLPAGVLAVVYAIILGQVWAFPLTRADGLAAPVRLGAAPELDALRLDLARITDIGRRSRAAAERWLAQHTRAAQIPLARWHAQYLASIRPLLERHDRLLIVPDGLLNLLPFAALYDAHAGRYVAETHEIVQAPSLATWAMLDLREQRADSARTERGVLAVGYSSAGRLPQAVAEAQSVAAQFAHAVLLEEAAATRAAFLAHAGEADLIHIASHGLHRADAPAFSYLEFADGRLTAGDLAGLTLRATTVALSACETGTGRLSGNELWGLVRAFLHAGARSVLATDWSVDDVAMRELMVEFVSALHNKERAAAALRAAQRAMIEGRGGAELGALAAHPFYWGGLALFGADAG